MLVANIKNKPIALNPLLIISIFLLIYAKLDTTNRSLLDDNSILYILVIKTCRQFNAQAIFKICTH